MKIQESSHSKGVSGNALGLSDYIIVGRSKIEKLKKSLFNFSIFYLPIIARSKTEKSKTLKKYFFNFSVYMHFFQILQQKNSRKNV